MITFIFIYLNIYKLYLDIITVLSRVYFACSTQMYHFMFLLFFVLYSYHHTYPNGNLFLISTTSSYLKLLPSYAITYRYPHDVVCFIFLLNISTLPLIIMSETFVFSSFTLTLNINILNNIFRYI